MTTKAPERVGQASPAFYGFVRLLFTVLTPLFARLRTEGIENIPREGPVIIALNHIAWTDIPLMSLRVPRITHYMAKIELFNIFLLGGILRLAGSFPVRRGEGDRESIRNAEQLLKQGEALVVFPEGHRSRTGQLQAGHPGTAYLALRSGAPVVPVAIFGTQHTLKGLRYGPFAPRVTVRYGKPVRFKGLDGKRTRETLARAADQIMRGIAAQLPPEYRGPYADLDSTEIVAGRTKVAEAEASAEDARP
jgi:1-acyl-sn-glycerol-3-phosphate acyltransferase